MKEKIKAKRKIYQLREKTRTKRKEYQLKEVYVRLTEGNALYSEQPLLSPAEALAVMRKEMSGYDREVLCVINLTAQFQPINFHVVSVGNIKSSIVSIPNILKSSILSNAACFMLIHNHPSGVVKPSKEDILVTKRIVEAGKLMDIPCLDHVIIGGKNGDYISLRGESILNFEDDTITMTAEDILKIKEEISLFKQTIKEKKPESDEDTVQISEFLQKVQFEMRSEIMALESDL